MPDWLKEWWPVVAFLMPFLTGAGLWAVRVGLASKSELTAEEDARDEAIAQCEKRLHAEIGRLGETVAKVDSRVAKLEHDFQHLPTKEQVHKLELSTSEMKGDVKAMRETMTSVANTAGRLEGYLLSAERRSSAA